MRTVNANKRASLERMENHDGMMHDHSMMHDHGMMDNSGASQHLLCPQDGMGMIMYMEGFRWTLKGGGSCLNFFVASWKLDTTPKFLLAMVCVVLMGIATEGIARWKHSVGQKYQSASNLRETNLRKLYLLQTGLQAATILSAYLLMLVVMTYSLELLLCVVGGLMIGYYIFDGDVIRHGGGSVCCNFLEACGEESAEFAPTDAATPTNLTESLLPRTTNDGFGSCCNDEEDCETNGVTNGVGPL